MTIALQRVSEKSDPFGREVRCSTTTSGGKSGFYTDLNEAQWAIVAPLLPAAKIGRMQTSETLIEVATTRLMLNRIAPA